MLAPTKIFFAYCLLATIGHWAISHYHTEQYHSITLSNITVKPVIGTCKFFEADW